MPPKISAYIATSLDGFIARTDGNIDWLEKANARLPRGEDCGFHQFLDTVDTLIMGRKTFEKILTFHEWPYGTTPIIVLSRHPDPLPEGIPDTVTHSSESPPELVKRLAHDGVKHIYVDGGLTIQGFLEADQVDEITITTIPILLGEGISLFGPLEKDIRLGHMDTHAYDFGFVQTKYAVIK
ncbi:MAG: dihydrofolate reductase family protein [Desulfobacterales bacterium]|nr:dihydrofolate reductase family protein [Desulfobacterales bacterium]